MPTRPDKGTHLHRAGCFADSLRSVRKASACWRRLETLLADGGTDAQRTFEARVRSLVTDVPTLPNFSHFLDSFREDPASTSGEGNMRSAFFAAYQQDQCEHVKLSSHGIDRRLKEGPEMVSANFVIPYPPGFPIMIPGQVINAETVEFMRKLDVTEIYGYTSALGLKLLNPTSLQAASARSEAVAGTMKNTKRKSARAAAHD